MAEHLPYDDELVLKYLDNEMPEEQRQAFEKSMESNASLKERYEQLRIATAAVLYYGVSQQVAGVHQLLKAELEQKITKPPVMAKRKVLRLSLAVAASIIFLWIGVKAYWLYALSPGKIYAEEYVAYKLPNTRSEDVSSPIEKAYSEKNYSWIIGPGKTEKQSSEEQLLTGLSYLELDKPKESIRCFDSILISTDNTYKQDAEFYLFLALIKNREYASALPLMKKINADPNHLYHSHVTRKTIREVQLLKWKSK
jgi:hypothetical protein